MGRSLGGLGRKLLLFDAVQEFQVRSRTMKYSWSCSNTATLAEDYPASEMTQQTMPLCWSCQLNCIMMIWCSSEWCLQRDQKAAPRTSWWGHAENQQELHYTWKEAKGKRLFSDSWQRLHSKLTWVVKFLFCSSVPEAAKCFSNEFLLSEVKKI